MGCEDSQLAFVFRKRKHGDPAGLRQGFHDQHAWHDRSSRKVPLEIIFVFRHRFFCHDGLADFHFFHFIYQKERLSCAGALP